MPCLGSRVNYAIALVYEPVSLKAVMRTKS
jgi:hypothetical protein